MIVKIKIPQNVEIIIQDNNLLKIKGKLGEIDLNLPKNISLKYDNSYIYGYSEDKAILGTFISLLKTNIKGVSQGFTIKLQLVGIGYRFLEVKM